MERLEELKEMLMCELEGVTQKGELSAAALNTVGSILDAIKDIETIKMYSEGGYSEEGYAREGDSYRGYSRSDGYARDYSGARRRNRHGQFSRNGSYSGDEMIDKLEKMMEDPGKGEQIRKELERMMERM